MPRGRGCRSALGRASPSDWLSLHARPRDAQIGDAHNPYARFTLDQLEDRYAELEEKIAQACGTPARHRMGRHVMTIAFASMRSAQDLAEEADKQNRHDAMRKDFAETISGFVDTPTSACSTWTTGEGEHAAGLARRIARGGDRAAAHLRARRGAQSQLEGVRNYEREVCRDYFEDALSLSRVQHAVSHAVASCAQALLSAGAGAESQLWSPSTSSTTVQLVRCRTWYARPCVRCGDEQRRHRDVWRSTSS